jgi:hypothetical protein
MQIIDTGLGVVGAGTNADADANRKRRGDKEVQATGR